MSVPICPKHKTDQMGQDDLQREMGNAPPTEFLHLLNPKNYKYLPPQYTHTIKRAGHKNPKSDHVKDIFS